MVEWAAKHFKTYLVMVITFITLVVFPTGKWFLGLLLDLQDSQARDLVQDRDIKDLQKLNWKMDGRFEIIQLEMKTLNDRNYSKEHYKELQEARQEWQAKHNREQR